MTSKPVILGSFPAPAGKAATRRAALNIARRYLSRADRMLVDAGFRLRVYEAETHFRVRLAK